MAIVSALALMGLRPPFGSSHLCGIRPHLIRIERAFACLVVLSNNQQLLARRSVVARANVAHPTVANVEAFNDGEAKWP